MRGLVSALFVAAGLWDLSGWDWALSSGFGDVTGFAARDSTWARVGLHEGLRVLYAGLLGLAIWQALQTPAPNSPTRAQRRWAVVVLLLMWLTVPALKQFSLTSCPWSLSAFGGEARWVPHWRLGVPDGGPGHCFPSGHAAGGFGFLALVSLWAPHRRMHPGPWRFWLVAVAVCGVAGSLAQVARGAHFLSHCLWSAVLCGLLALLLVRPRRAAAPERPSPARA